MITSQDYFEDFRQSQEYNEQLQQYYREMERREIEQRWQLWDYHKALETLNSRKDSNHIQSIA